MRTSATPARLAVSIVLLGSIVAFGNPDRADAQSKCQSLKFKAAGATAERKAVCHAKAAKAGTLVDAACLTSADDQLARKWSKAEASGDCVNTDDTAAGIAAVDQCLGAIEAVVDPPPPPTSPCCNLGNACAHGVDDEACATFFSGTPGPAGSVCNGATGACELQTAQPGKCCMLADANFCTAGPHLDLSGCVPPQFFDFPFAICEPNGACALP